MRKLIAGMKISLDAKTEGTEGIADWVDAWSEEYGLTDRVDACVLGGAMYPGYEQYWTPFQTHPDEPNPLSGKMATPGEVAWAGFAAETPHYVLSTSLTSAAWPNTRFVRTLDDIATLKQASGKAIYLMGGARVTSSIIDAGLLDELRLIVYPLIAGEGSPLFSTVDRRGLELRDVERLSDGRVSMVYEVR
jgi:dihydrofolate reductase